MPTYRVYGAPVRNQVTGEVDPALVGKLITIVTRGTTTPFPIQDGAADPIPDSALTVQSAHVLPAFDFVSASPAAVYLDWYYAETGDRGEILFEEVARQATLAAQTAAEAARDAAAATLVELQAYIAANPGGGGGTMDHNQLSNLVVGDPHTQYLNTVRGDQRYYTKAQVDAAIAAAVTASSLEDRKRTNHTGTQGLGTIDLLSSALAVRPIAQPVVNGTEARPEGSNQVLWIGGDALPVNMGPNDLAATGASATPGDTTPPSTPTGLGSTGVASTSLTLTWTASTDNVGVTGYRVRQNGVVLAGSPAGTTRLITGLAASTPYTFEVAARDANGNWSAYSAPHPVTTGSSSDTIAPTAPTGVAASAITAAGFTLNWTASTDNVGVTGYRVLLNGVQYATPSGTSQVVTGRTASTPYGVTVQARDAAGNWSDASSEITVTTSAGGSLPTHSVFATPPGALVKTVEASAYENATGFYTYGTEPIGAKVKGARLYIPNGISVPTTATINLYVPAPGATPVLGTPTKTATMTGITANAWNTVNFPSVEAVDPGEFFWIGVKFADGTWLGVSCFTDAFVPASDGYKLVLADRDPASGIVRSYRRIAAGSTVALTGGTERDSWFGMDVILEEA